MTVGVLVLGFAPAPRAPLVDKECGDWLVPGWLVWLEFGENGRAFGCGIMEVYSQVVGDIEASAHGEQSDFFGRGLSVKVQKELLVSCPAWTSVAKDDKTQRAAE